MSTSSDSYLLPVPVTVSTPDNETIARIQGEILRLAQSLHIEGWGADGDIIGMMEVIPTKNFWWLPEMAISYSDEDIQTMADSLTEQQLNNVRNGQLQPVIGVRVNDPRKKPCPGGGIDGTILVVDGIRRIQGQRRASIKQTTAIIFPYYGYYDWAMQMVANKTAQRTYSLREIGKLVQGVRLAYEASLHQLADGEQPDPYPNLDRLARLLGRSDAYISQALRLYQICQEESAFAQLIDSGTLSEWKATELLAAKDGAERLQLAQQIASIPGGTRQQVQRQIRLLAQHESTTTTYLPALQIAVPVDQLRFPQHGTLPVDLSVAIMEVAHNLRVLVRAYQEALAQQGQGTAMPPLLTRLGKVLADREIDTFLDQLDHTTT